MFSPTFVDIGIFIGTIGFFFVLFLLYARTFPVIAQAEVKTILKSSGEFYKKRSEQGIPTKPAITVLNTAGKKKDSDNNLFEDSPKAMHDRIIAELDRIESNYVNGQRHGLQKVWFLNGQLAKRKNLSKGREDGLQQAWLENGKIYVNYEAKNGRIFGMNRANLCYKLKNEKVQYANKK
jgi:hypothetical protein